VNYSIAASLPSSKPINQLGKATKKGSKNGRKRRLAAGIRRRDLCGKGEEKRFKKRVIKGVN
jgi:hypothetical protein